MKQLKRVWIVETSYFYSPIVSNYFFSTKKKAQTFRSKFKEWKNVKASNNYGRCNDLSGTWVEIKWEYIDDYTETT